jgi:hypothetical protein
MIRKFEVIENNNTSEFILKHLEGKIKTANEKIESIINAENNAGKVYRENRVALLLSWKDCLNYYSIKLIDLTNKQNPTKIGKSFDELYTNGIIAGQIQKSTYKGINDNNERFYEYNFNKWLESNKGWNPNNMIQYYELLDEHNFFEFLRDYNIELAENLVKAEIDKMRKSMMQKDQLEIDIKELQIAIEILGLKQNYNNFYSISPKTSHIKNVLNEHQITTNEAWEIVTNRKESFATNTPFTKNVIEPILQYLRDTKFDLPKENNTSIDNQKETEAPPTEPRNPHKGIFINGYAYELFEKLRYELFELTPTEELSNYSFIMQQMIGKDYLIQTNHRKLIEFLEAEFQIKFGAKYSQFTNPTPVAKMNVFKRFNKEFQPKIKALLN